jgi:hypothetical protein
MWTDCSLRHCRLVNQRSLSEKRAAIQMRHVAGLMASAPETSELRVFLWRPALYTADSLRSNLVSIALLQVDGQRVMKTRRYPSGLELRRQEISLFVPNDVQVIDQSSVLCLDRHYEIIDSGWQLVVNAGSPPACHVPLCQVFQFDS